MEVDFDINSVNIYTSTRTIYQLIHDGVLSNELDTGDFPIKYKSWDTIQKSRFIESILLRIPVSSMYFDMSTYPNIVILDGYQRLSAIKSFVVDKDLSLEGLEYLKELEGCTFTTLPKNLSRRVEETEILIHSIQPGTPKSISHTVHSLLHMF